MDYFIYKSTFLKFFPNKLYFFQVKGKLKYNLFTMSSIDIALLFGKDRDAVLFNKFTGV